MKVIIKAFGPGPAYVEIKRVGESMSDPRSQKNHIWLSEGQEASYQTAIGHVKQGKIKAAQKALESVFERVIVEREGAI